MPFAGSNSKRVLDSEGVPFFLQFFYRIPHLQCHGYASQGILFESAAQRIPEKNKDRIADKLIDGSALLDGDIGHFLQVTVE